MNKTVLIGMSGGVDSSVAAWLLQHQGHTCIGGTMQLLPGETVNTDDAQKVADRMGIMLHVFQMEEDFRSCVIEDFVRCYESGATPNPCVVCNRHLKFGILLEKAMNIGCTHIATGHYARIHQDSESGRFLLLKGKDLPKDQSYFLYSLTQHQLAHTLFPLGELTKEEVREVAQAQGFVTAHKKDSQDICFIPDGDYRAFLERYTGKHYPCGIFLDEQGNVVGKHNGAIGYTLGQRKGLGLAMGAPVYVCAKDMAANTVTVGPNESLFSDTLLAADWNWIAFPAPSEPIRCLAKARSRMTEQPATVYPEENGTYKVVFDVPQRAITPGQAVVLYDGDLVIGGGTIL